MIVGKAEMFAAAIVGGASVRDARTLSRNIDHPVKLAMSAHWYFKTGSGASVSIDSVNCFAAIRYQLRHRLNNQWKFLTCPSRSSRCCSAILSNRMDNLFVEQKHFINRYTTSKQLTGLGIDHATTASAKIDAFDSMQHRVAPAEVIVLKVDHQIVRYLQVVIDEHGSIGSIKVGVLNLRLFTTPIAPVKFATFMENKFINIKILRWWQTLTCQGGWQCLVDCEDLR